MLRPMSRRLRSLVLSLVAGALVAVPVEGQTHYGQTFSTPPGGALTLSHLYFGSTFGYRGDGTVGVIEMIGGVMVGPYLWRHTLPTVPTDIHPVVVDPGAFAPGVTLAGGRTYFAFFDTPIFTVSSRANDREGGGLVCAWVGSSCHELFTVDGPTYDIMEFEVTLTPEPTAVVLLGTGLFALGGIAVRRRRRDR